MVIAVLHRQRVGRVVRIEWTRTGMPYPDAYATCREHPAPARTVERWRQLMECAPCAPGDTWTLDAADAGWRP